MRRKDKEVIEKETMEQIIKSCTVCRLGLSYQDVPYIVPLCFGYDGKAIYFHTAREGRKIEMMIGNSEICFEFESDVRIIEDKENPCNWSCSFRSIIGYGSVEELIDRDHKVTGLKHIMHHYSGSSWDFDSIPLNGVRVWKIVIKHMSGKQSLDFQ